MKTMKLPTNKAACASAAKQCRNKIIKQIKLIITRPEKIVGWVHWDKEIIRLTSNGSETGGVLQDQVLSKVLE